MFEQMTQLLAGESVAERLLRQMVDEIVQRRVFVIDFPPHGSGAFLAENRDMGGFDRLTRLLEEGADHLAEASAAAEEQGRAAARQARALAAFARTRPAGELDRPDEEIGAAAAATRAARPAVLTDVSEWAVDEVMVALSVTASAASRLLKEALTLDEQLPATLDAAESGAITWAHAQVMADLLGSVRDDETRAGLEARLLAFAPGHTGAQLRVTGRRAVLRADAEALAERAVRAVRDRSVRIFTGDDGMATLSATMPEPLAAACHDALERLADATATPGDERTRQQRMVDCLYDLVLRPGNSSLPPVQAKLTIVASGETLTGGNEPGEINGRPASAAMVREVAYALGLLPRPQRAAAPASDAPTSGDAIDAAAVADGARSSLGDLLRTRRLAGTALVERPEIALVEELTGQLLALTNVPEILRRVTCGRRGCRNGTEACEHLDLSRLPGLGPPPGTDAYRPPEPLDRFVRARDRRCRFPGCRARPIRCDLDHTLPWPLGPTAHDNLCCLCRHHHRLSHQAPGWRLRGLPDGGLEWTTPGGQTITTHPPRFGADDDLRPRRRDSGPRTRSVAPVLDLRTRILGRPAQPGDEPAPF